MAHRWRVQATWTVDGEEREYAPVFARTKFGAARLRRDMESTLAHFPTLVVTVDKVPATEEIHSEPKLARGGLVHLRRDGADRTACGIPVAHANWTAPEIFEPAGPHACRECAASRPGS